MSAAKSRESTRERLLAAAGELFADKGFHATSVREICDRAGANVAAINYHFGDKGKLHEAVLFHVFQFAGGKDGFRPPEGGTTSPREQLLAWVLRFLESRLSTDRPAWHRQLMMRESTTPSKALRALIEKGIRKHFEYICALVGQLAGKKATPELIERCVASIIGQCVYYMVAQNFIPKLYKHVKLTPEGIEETAGHIVEFSLGGIAARNATGGKAKSRSKRKAGS